MSPFYQKLTHFGTLVNSASHAKNIDIANYFTVLHPAHPIVKDSETARPGIRFSRRCPQSVKREVAVMWKMVFG